VEKLKSYGINVVIVKPEFPNLPDAVFPNNWFSTHIGKLNRDSVVIYYPMKNESRRKERNSVLMEKFQSLYTKSIHLEQYESDDIPEFLEGTGALVLDRVSKIAYANISDRCSEILVQEWAKSMNYTYIIFHATDKNNFPVYHTNVVLSIGSKMAILCSEMIKDIEEREILLDSLRKNHSILEISESQVSSFCGNVLELYVSPEKTIMVMSTNAFYSFSDEEKKIILENVNEICHSDISTIEKIGGGSARCMLSEIF